MVLAGSGAAFQSTSAYREQRYDFFYKNQFFSFDSMCFWEAKIRVRFDVRLSPDPR